MPSTYTVNLGIEKPATGEQSGTWGDTTNVNFDIIDQAVNGSERVTLTSAGTSGSPNDLNIVNGSTTSSEGRNKWLEIYSASDLGGSAYVRLVPNDAEKILFIRNSLAGSQSVLLFQGTYNASNDLEIPAGVDMVVKFDGAGASATVTDVFTKLRATEITTPTLTAGTADINGGSVDGATVGAASASTGAFTTLTASTSLNIASSTTVDGVLDEDNMASDSATKLATQQSIKAYVDSQVGAVDTLAEILANGNTSGANNLIIDNGQALTSNTINETTAGSGVTIDSVLLKDDGVNATNLEITNIKANDGTAAATIANSTGNFTITNFISNSVDIGGGAIDGTVIGGSTAAAGTFTTGQFNTSLNVDGTTNLDVVDIDGAVDMASTLTVGGTTNDGTALVQIAQSGTGRAFSVNRNVVSATRAVVNLAQLQASGGAEAVLDIQQTASASRAIKVTPDGSIDRFSVYGTGALVTTPVAGGHAVFNEGGVDADFRVESDSNANMLFVDAGNNRVGIGTGSPLGDVQIVTETAGTVFNVNHNTGGPYPKASGIGLGATSTAYTVSSDGGTVAFTGGAGIYAENTAASGNPTNLVFWTNLLGSPAEAMRLAGSGAATFSSTIALGDSKQIFFGADSDGRISFDGTDTLNITASNGSATTVNVTANNFKIGGANRLISGTANDSVVINEDSADVDFRVESNDNANMLFVDGGANHVNIGTSSDLGQVLNVEGGLALGTDPTVTWTSNYIKFQTRSASVPVIEFLASASGSYAPRIDIYNGAGAVQHRIDAGNATTFNETGADNDFRVESSGNANMLFVDGGNNRVGVGMSTPLEPLHATGRILSTTTYGGSTQRIGTSIGQNGNTRADIDFRRWTGASTNHGVGMIEVADTGIMRFYVDSVTSNTPATTERISLDPTGAFTTTPAAGGHAVFNEGGADADFRVESDANANMLFVDASVDRVGVGATPMTNGSTFQVTSDSTESTNMQLTLRGASNTNKQMIMGFDTTANTAHITTQIAGSAPTPLIFKTGDVVFNEAGINFDFRVESDANTHALFVDAGNSRVGINTSSPGYPLDVVGSIHATDRVISDDGQFYNNENAVSIAVLNTWTSLGVGTASGLYVFRDASAGGMAVFSADSSAGATSIQNGITGFQMRYDLGTGQMQVQVTSGSVTRTIKWVSLLTNLT